MKHALFQSLVLVLVAAGATTATSACALTSKADLVETRYFSPERVRTTSNDAARASAPKVTFELRLGRVTSGPSLRDRIAYRDAPYELGYYDDLRWTERPETYVRRGLGRALFEERGLHRALGGLAPTLDVEVVAFDEMRLPGARGVRVQLKILLHEESGVLFEDTLTVERPVSGDKPKIEDVVATMAIALDAACEQVTQRVEGALAARRSLAGNAGEK
jgi:cholesterol transport system auxiliary component